MRMVAISPDTVEAAGGMVEKRALSMTVLSDAALTVTEQYNLRHDKAMASDPKRKMVRSLAIPTTFFVGADGLVNWIDQAEDYRVRSAADRVLAAVESALA